MSLRTMSDPCEGTNWLSLGRGNTTMSLSERWKLATFQQWHQQPKGMASSHGWPLRTKTSATTLPESAITVQRTWSSRASAGGVEQSTGDKEPTGAATWPRAGNGTFCSFSQSCAHTSSSLHGSWRSTAVCSSSVSSPSDRLSSPANVDKVDARSRDSTWQEQSLIQDSHGVTATEHTYRKGLTKNTLWPLSDVRC